jgi:uncharacterized Fe-S cluster protein YjdI
MKPPPGGLIEAGTGLDPQEGAGSDGMAPETRVRVTAAGPYVVKGGVALRDANGAPIETGRTYALCRCGASTTKPLCSDAHLAIGFSGEETADRGRIAERREAYRGEGIVVYDDRSICAHVGHCTDRLSSVFKLKQEPWIDPQGADAEAIATVVRTCQRAQLRPGGFPRSGRGGPATHRHRLQRWPVLGHQLHHPGGRRGVDL